jgi:transcriptional regulator with XRE-family HTH domain
VKSFGDILREARESSGLTQKELAQRVGIDDSYVSRIERGLSSPPVREKVLSLADTLKITDKAERAYFLLSAGYAGLEDLEGLDFPKLTSHLADAADTDAALPLLGRGGFNFPSLVDLELEMLLNDIRNLLGMPNLSSEHRSEILQLLQSFITWLRFHYGGRS